MVLYICIKGKLREVKNERHKNNGCNNKRRSNESEMYQTLGNKKNIGNNENGGDNMIFLPIVIGGIVGMGTQALIQLNK